MESTRIVIPRELVLTLASLVPSTDGAADVYSVLERCVCVCERCVVMVMVVEITKDGTNTRICELEEAYHGRYQGRKAKGYCEHVQKSKNSLGRRSRMHLHIFINISINPFMPVNPAGRLLKGS